LRTVCLVEHVGADTTWVPDLVKAVHNLRRASLRVLVGVEAKLLDHSGRLDLPESIEGLDHVLIADHQFPSDEGPLSPSRVRAMLALGKLDAQTAVECLVEATVGAMALVDRPIVAHPFSLLPKIGLDESDVSDSLADHLSRNALRHGALVEMNEKWGCPGPRLALALAKAGVQLVAGSDSHDCATIGAYDRVRTNLREEWLAADLPASPEIQFA